MFVSNPLPLPSPLDYFGVDNAFDWYNIARPRILQMLAENEYGFIPPRAEFMRVELLRERRGLVGGSARRREFRITLGNAGKEFSFAVLVYSPEHFAGRPVAVAALNFQGNAGAAEEDDVFPVEAPHHTQPGRWPIKQLMESGILLATAARNDFYFDSVDPESRENSIYRIFGECDGRDRRLTAISAWAFGYRTLCDFLLTLPEVDPLRLWIHGHSRLGKTALWVAANDPRISGVVSNDSGCCGAAISRDKGGETLKKILDRFPYWFVRELERYIDNESALPWDQHWLVALSAPRPVLVASAIDDKWADPENEFRSAVAAGEVYRLFGVPGLEVAAEFPAADTPMLRRGVGYYVRSGGHDVTPYDWAQTSDFIRLNS